MNFKLLIKILIFILPSKTSPKLHKRKKRTTRQICFRPKCKSSCEFCITSHRLSISTFIKWAQVLARCKVQCYLPRIPQPSISTEVKEAPLWRTPSQLSLPGRSMHNYPTKCSPSHTIFRIHVIKVKMFSQGEKKKKNGDQHTLKHWATFQSFFKYFSRKNDLSRVMATMDLSLYCSHQLWSTVQLFAALHISILHNWETDNCVVWQDYLFVNFAARNYFWSEFGFLQNTKNVTH